VGIVTIGAIRGGSLRVFGPLVHAIDLRVAPCTDAIVYPLLRHVAVLAENTRLSVGRQSVKIGHRETGDHAVRIQAHAEVLSRCIDLEGRLPEHLVLDMTTVAGDRLRADVVGAAGHRIDSLDPVTVLYH